MTTRFDEQAAAWEADPACRKSCELAYKALMQQVPQLQPGAMKPNAMGVQCGSGMLATMLAPHVHTLTGIDISKAMAAAFNANAAAQGAVHMEAIPFDIDNPDFAAVPEATARLVQKVEGQAADETLRWDFIFSDMLCHCFSDLNQWVQIAYFCMAPGGNLAMFCLDHSGDDAALFPVVWKQEDTAAPGPKPAEVAKLVEEAGFEKVSAERAFALERSVDPAKAGGRTSIEVPVVLCLGHKPLR